MGLGHPLQSSHKSVGGLLLSCQVLSSLYFILYTLRPAPQLSGPQSKKYRAWTAGPRRSISSEPSAVSAHCFGRKLQAAQ